MLQFETLDKICKIWNADIEYSDEEGIYYVKGISSNRDIESGESISFSYIAEYDEIKMFFTDGYIYSETYILQPEDYTIKKDVKSQWSDYSIFDLAIENIGKYNIEDWTIDLETNSEIEEVWGANILEEEQGIYRLSYLTYNSVINTNDSIHLQIKVKGDKEPTVNILSVVAVNWDKKSIIRGNDDEDDGMEIQGIELTDKQYGNLLKVFSEEEIKAMTPTAIQLYKNDESLKVVSEDTIYVKTDYYYLMGKEIKEVDEVITEGKVRQELNKKQSRASTTHSTSMKQLTISIVSGASVNYRIVTLKNKWLKLPKVRSYDVIALRPNSDSFTFNTYADSTISGYQKYNTKGYVRYKYGSDNLKILTGKGAGKCGIGLSMNLKDDAKVLENVLMVTFVSKQKGFSVFGTYQHAKVNVSLKDSKKYSFGPTGYGGVLIFNKSIRDSYDKMQGVNAIHVMGGGN